MADTIRTFELIPPRGGWLHQALMTRCASSKRSPKMAGSRFSTTCRAGYRGSSTWSALLPLTYETVEDQGVRQLSEDLADIYSWLENGLRLQRIGGTSQDLLQWWGSWETDWGYAALRTLSVIHEVIVDLDLKKYG